MPRMKKGIQKAKGDLIGFDRSVKVFRADVQTVLSDRSKCFERAPDT